MKPRSGFRTRGSALIEFTLIGIPIIFILISVFEGSRGMWLYTTLAHAAKEGARYAAVHGQTFVKICKTGTCTVTVNDIATQVKNAAAGLDPADIYVREFPGVATCTASDVTTCPQMSTLFGGGGATALSLPTGLPVTITVAYRFRSALSMFWPGAGPGIVFGVVNLPATAQETVQF